MKKMMLLLAGISLLMICYSCTKDGSEDISGDQSPMGEVGVTVSSGSWEIAGISNFSAIVTNLESGISKYSATATITNPLFKNMVANFPGITINGDEVSITDLEVQQTKEGIKSLTGSTKGVIVKYDSKVGDTYPVGSTGKLRTVVSKSSTDDYSYGFLLIKTIQVEQEADKLKSSGITKYTYVANHRFGLVGVKVDFDDGSSATFPVFSSAEN
jgi:hypothetical protein